MSILEEVLLEEYERTLRIEKLLKEEIDTLPKGSIQEKKIKGRMYFYLQYRCNNSVKSKYVKASDVERLKQNIQKRNDDIKQLKELQKTKSQIMKALGKEFINEHTTPGIY